MSVYKIKIEHLVDGVINNIQEVVLDCPANEKVEFNPKFDYSLGGEHVLNISVLNNGFIKLLGSQHVIANASNAILSVLKNEITFDDSKLNLVDGDFNVGIVGENFHVLFNRATGKLSSLKFDGIEYIEQSQFSLSPNFWRAPTDNDRGAKKDFELAQWYIASNMQDGAILSATKEDNNTAKVMTNIKCSNGAHVAVDYIVNSNGRVQVDFTYNGETDFPDLFNLGFKMKLSNDFGRIKWYGRGIEETYVDRYKSQLLGIYNQNIDEISTYSKPQEYGNHYDTRWFEIYDKNYNGLRISSSSPFEFSALPYSDVQLMNTYHENQLPSSDGTYLRVNYKQVGVGGDNSWGLWSHKQYIPDSKTQHKYSFIIESIK